MTNKKMCVFTTLIGGYEMLNEQPVAHKSNLDFFCFTDDPKLKSETWKIVNVDPILPFDNFRSAKAIKICAHRYLPDFAYSLYIDNSVLLKTTPELIFKDFSSDKFDMCCIHHSYRTTVLDEYEEVISSIYDKSNVIMEQFNAYSLINPELFFQKPIWGGFLIRKHTKPEVVTAMEDWLVQIMRYSRRDQLSLNYILDKHKLELNIVDLDNYHSRYHDWPTAIRYGNPLFKPSIINNLDSGMRIFAQEKKVERLAVELKEKNKRIEELKQQVNYYSQSKSWRITKPLRQIMNIFRRNEK
jgi:hypothetical protein